MSSFRYLAVDWRHDHAAEPGRLYSEVDLAGWEKRKVEEFRSGQKFSADATTRSGQTCLGEEAIPSIGEIAMDPQFSGREISKEESERVWLEAKLP